MSELYQQRVLHITDLPRSRKEGLDTTPILDIVISPNLRDILGPVAAQTFGKNFLLQHALLNMPSSYPGGSIVETPSSFRRATTPWELPLNHFIQGEKFLFNTLIMKGGCSSGEESDEIAFDQKVQRGYFELTSAQKDMEMAHTFLAQGVKASIPIGYIVLDPVVLTHRMNVLIQRTRNVLGEDQRRYRLAMSNRIRQLDKFLADNPNELPVLYGRLAASPQRLHSYNRADTTPHLYKAMQLLALENNVDYENIPDKHLWYLDLASKYVDKYETTALQVGWDLECGIRQIDLGLTMHDFEETAIGQEGQKIWANRRLRKEVSHLHMQT